MNCQTLQEETPRHNWMCVCWTFITELVRYGGYTCSCLPVVCVCAVPEYYRADNRTLASLRRHSGTARPLLPSIVPSFLPSFLPHIHPPSLSLHSSLYPSHIPFILCFVSFISSRLFTVDFFSSSLVYRFTECYFMVSVCLSVCFYWIQFCWRLRLSCLQLSQQLSCNVSCTCCRSNPQSIVEELVL